MDDGLYFVVQDEGFGFDFQATREKNRQLLEFPRAEVLKPGRRNGLFIMSDTFDCVYNFRDNAIYLAKKI